MVNAEDAGDEEAFEFWEGAFFCEECRLPKKAVNVVPEKTVIVSLYAN